MKFDFILPISRVISKTIISLLFFFFIFLHPAEIFGQSHNHWTRSFNEESSLLSGAVVGGGSGPSAIYYNPSSIAEITESKFSLHASLFSFEFITLKNALGNGIDLKSTRGFIEPRFLSYMIQPKNHPEWSFEIAFLNNENYNLDLTQSVDKNMDVLTNLPGKERYFALFQYLDHYRDDWIGFGGSWKINPNLFVGASIFVSVKQLNYQYALDIECFTLQDSLYIDNLQVPFYSASYQENDYVKFNDYRLLSKIGALYKIGNLSIGLSICTPSVHVYSDGKKVSRKVKQSNISLPETGDKLPDYVIVDYQEKDRVKVNLKNPISVAAGLTYFFPDKSKTIYTTVEYFSSLDPYRIVQAKENSDIAGGLEFENINFNEWLTFVSGAKPVFNAAVGYRWNIKENLMLLAGLRTDFNYRKDQDYSPYTSEKSIKGLDINFYHITGGLSLRIRGQDLMAGLQYTAGRQQEMQMVNLSDPVEYNTTELKPLQGTRDNSMNVMYNSISIYFGATFNFGSNGN